MDRRATDRRHNDVEIPDIGQMIKVVLKHKVLAFMMIIIPITLTALYLKTKPDIYRATASVILEPQNVNIPQFSDILSPVKFDNLTVPTQVELIMSPSLARKTINSLGLDINENDRLTVNPKKSVLSSLEKDNPVNTQGGNYAVTKKFFENLNVAQQGTSRTIEISFDSYNPNHAAQVANTHAQQYVDMQVSSKLEKAKRLKEWINGQIVSLREQSLKKSRAVQQFKSESGMIQGLNSEDLIYEQISDISKQLNPIATKKLELQARSDLIKQGQISDISAVINSELIQSLKARSSLATQRLQSLRADYGNNHPDVISARKEVEQIENDINQGILSIRRSIENELETITRQENMLRQRLEDLQMRADNFQEQKITLQALQSEEAVSRSTLSNFLSRSEEINSQIDLERQDVRIFSYADIPGEPKGSKKLIILMGVSILSVLAALGTIFLIETMDKGIQDKDEVKQALGLKLLGTLPYETSPLSRVIEKHRSPYVEEIKRVFIHLSALKEKQVLLFTSSRAGEGKSLTAVALAYYLRSIGKKPLIIDANTVKPQIATITGVAPSPGFYELLTGTHTFEEVVKENEHGLVIIPAGEESSFSSDLLVAGRFQEQIETLKKHHDYILIDCACAFDASDAEVLAGMADQTFVIAAWAKTPKKELRKIAESMREFSTNAPHVILNKIPQKVLRKSKG